MKRGFTLIELLVAISIIGILAALIISNLSDARARARDSSRKSNLRELKTALRLYYNDNQTYPASLVSDANGDLMPDAFASADTETIYMKQLPTEFTYTIDPVSTDAFFLKVTLENASDSDLLTSQARCPNPPEAYAATDYAVCED
jgi:prepilin-type N-terminal cleavage/methylation domain-containing protein